jgi:hypothetical protein
LNFRFRQKAAAGSHPRQCRGCAESSRSPKGFQFYRRHRLHRLRLDGVISGTGVNGDGDADTVALNGNNTFTGGTNIGTANLTVAVGNANGLGTGPLTISATVRYHNECATPIASVGVLLSETTGAPWVGAPRDGSQSIKFASIATE